MKQLWKNSRGDTIVEVLLALAVLSVVLVGAFATSKRTLDNSRQAQERSEALKTMESQVERLKNIETTLDPFDTQIKCINTDTSSATYNQLVSAYNTSKSGAMPANTAADDPFTGTNGYSAQCQQQNGGVIYYLSVEHSDTSAAGQRFYTFRVRWDRVGGSGREEAKITYGVVGGPSAGANSFCGYTCVLQRRADEACGGRCPRPVKPPNDPDYFNWTFGNTSSRSAATCDWYMGDSANTIRRNTACSPGQGFSFSYINEFPSTTNYVCKRFTWKLIMHYPTGDQTFTNHTDYIPWSKKHPDGTPCP
jgi:type II secretory pathway pseudopilin PulG